MSRAFRPPSLEAVAEVRRLASRQLTVEEFDAWVNAPMSAEEREEIEALIDWYRRRYPTASERLAQARRAWAQWSRTMPPSADDPPHRKRG